MKDRFDQTGYRVYQNVEVLLTKPCKHEEFEDALEAVCSFYGDNFDRAQLRTQLLTFGTHFSPAQPKRGNIDIFGIRDYFRSLSPGQVAPLSQVARLRQLVLVMPATNATSERSFSALRRIKTYLRTTMQQERLNYVMVLHVHKARADSINTKVIHNEFISHSPHRVSIFKPLDL